MHRGPRVAVTRAAVLVAVVAGPQGAGKDGDVVLYRSTDEGGSWGSPVIVNDVPAAAREGLHGLAASPDGVVVLTWLDLRQKGTRVMAAVSRDHGATWSGDVLVYASPDGAVCECCHPSAAVAPDGTVAVMFRNQLQGARDLYVAGSRDGLAFANAAKQGVGTWVLNACPMDGGGLAATPGGLVSAWRREDGIFLSTPAAPEQRLGTGRDPAVAASPAGTDIAWTGAEGVVLRRGASSVVLGKGRFPALLAFPSHTLVAYEQQGRVVTAVVPR